MTHRSDGRSTRLSQDELHQEFLSTLGDDVIHHTPVKKKPLQADLRPPLPQHVRVYMYNVTSPPGGRPTGEHKAQLIVPGQKRGERASFDHSNGHMVLLIGFSAASEVFILWDAGLHRNFAYSKNVQVKGRKVYEAIAGKIGTQERHLRTGTEVAITSNRENLREAILLRQEMTIERLVEE